MLDFVLSFEVGWIGDVDLTLVPKYGLWKHYSVEKGAQTLILTQHRESGKGKYASSRDETFAFRELVAVHFWGICRLMQEQKPVRWLQLTYKVPSEPSQKRVWVWRRLQNLGAYALQNSVYLLPASEEVEKHFRQLAHDVREMGGEASVFVVVALDTQDEQRILQALLTARNDEYHRVSLVCGRFLIKVTKLVETQVWDEQVQAEFAEVMEKVHVLFRTAKRHDVLGNMTATARAEAAEGIAICEQMFRLLLDAEFGKARRLLEQHQKLLLIANTAEPVPLGREAIPTFPSAKQNMAESSQDGIVEPPI